MCYFDQTQWACGYWRWGHFRQQCNKEYRMGETCGLKLVYEIKVEHDVCKLCHDTEKKQRRYDKMYRDVQRWQQEANRNAIIETTCGEMQEISGQIYRLNEEHEFRVQEIGGGTDSSVLSTSSFASPPRSFPIRGTGPSIMPAPIRLPIHSDNSINHHWHFETAPLPSPNLSSSFYSSKISRNRLGVDTSSSSLPPNSTSLRTPNIRPQAPARDKITSRSTLDSEDEDQMPYGKTVVAFEPFGESSQTPAFTDLHQQQQHISQPKEVNRTLDFESSPSLKQIESFISPLSDNTDRVVAFTCLVNWQVLAVYKTELEPGTDLRKVVTLTGTLTCAELNTCNQFMKKIWDSTAMMEIVAKFVENPSTRHGKLLYLAVTIAKTYDDEAGERSLPIALTSFHFRGPLCKVAILLQQLAWLAAAFPLPTRDILTVSVPFIKNTGSGMFEMDVRKVLPGQDGQFCLFRDLDNTQCWHNLLRGAVLAYGFPISNRHEGLGLEIPFDLMLGLADIRTQINAGDKTILLGGSGIILYPTKRLSGGMQWHCALVDDEDDHTTQRYDSAVAIIEQNMEEFPSQRMFLGYYPQAEVLLGTRELVDSNGLQATESKFPLSPPRVEFANEGTLTGGFSVKGILNMNLSGKYVMTKTLRISLGGRGFHELVDEAEQQPAIVYDGETKSAWLVSELSIVLHLALSYLSSHKIRDRRQTGCKQLEGEWPLLPYAEPCSDGGREARRVCKQPENCRLELWAEETKNKTFGDVIEDMLKDFQSVRDGVVAQGKATRIWPMPKYGLRGWEYTDFLGRKTHFCQKEVPREGHYAPWWELAKEKNTLVILGNGFGSLIRPKASSKSPFGLVNIPPGSRLLVASQPCMLMMMPFVDRARPALGSLEWRSIAKHQRSCNSFCDKTSCFSIQILRAKSSLAKDYTERPRERVLSAQAVIFGECEYYHTALFNAMFMIGSPSSCHNLFNCPSYKGPANTLRAGEAAHEYPKPREKSEPNQETVRKLPVTISLAGGSRNSHPASAWLLRPQPARHISNRSGTPPAPEKS
ncbi:hypothetical protein VFPPC_11318 [Pochonia chlamydosporia 170]|uniref:Uncharacterized protein n=1 Tax=Pochonia chlamydosporia 170 TaxID=1380566 RepID=A0A179EYM7_METCM|nr:hypothetical protein VFPPC_11318 [Pochonia chlamydosporia 170]OAQ58110.2 hypothetical protein VFPPC_11318 [Pochonia chlamydosporia 170]